MTTLNPKTASFRLLYSACFRIVINLGIGWILDNWVIPLINWFNHLAFVWKFLLFILEGINFLLYKLKIVTSKYRICILKLPENIIYYHLLSDLFVDIWI